jgi:hypothetical protein
MTIGEQNTNIHKALSFDYDAVEKLYEYNTIIYPIFQAILRSNN